MQNLGHSCGSLRDETSTPNWDSMAGDGAVAVADTVAETRTPATDSLEEVEHIWTDPLQGTDRRALRCGNRGRVE